MNEVYYVSRCLLGKPGLLYHGGVCKFALKWMDLLQRSFTVIALCPERLGGLPSPRAGSRVIRKPGQAERVVTIWGKKDVTEPFLKGRDKVLAVLKGKPVVGAFLLRNSPACDPEYGVLGRALVKQGIKCFQCHRTLKEWKREIERLTIPQLF